MKLGTNGFDIWVFHKQKAEPEYLLLHISQEKADKWDKSEPEQNSPDD